MRKDSSGHWQVWVASARLTAAKRLTGDAADSGWPVWSPDGSLIAFDADRGAPPAKEGIYVMDKNGGNLRRVTTLPANAADDLAPRFSPDGSRLVFTRYRGKGRSEKAALFTVRLDGSRVHQLTPFSIHAGHADWSPGGKRIVFEAYPNPDAFGDVYVVSANGGRATNLTRNPVGEAGSADPVWSPDGRKILFLDNRRVSGLGRSGLATMNPNGSDRSFVSKNNLELHQPDWESVR